MADTSLFPDLQFFQWSRPTAPNPRLAAGITASATTLTVTAPPLDENGLIVAKAFLMGAKTNGYTETIYVPAGAVQGYGNAPSSTYLGTTFTGVVRGIDLSGIDYTTTASLAIAHTADSPVFCNVSGIIPMMMKAWMHGNISSGANNLILGDGTAADATVKHKDDSGTVAFMRRKNSTGKPQFSNDGSVWVDLDNAGVGVLTAGDGIDSTELGAAKVEVLLGTDPGLEFVSSGLEAKVKAAGGITKDSDGLSVDQGADYDFTGAFEIGSVDATQLTDGSSVTVHYHPLTKGVATRTSATGSGSETIAHGLGVTPKYIRILAFSSSLGGSWSDGNAKSTSDENCLSWNTSAFAIQGGWVLYVVDSSGTNYWRATLSTLDATNIVLGTTKIGTTGDLSIKWEAWA